MSETPLSSKDKLDFQTVKQHCSAYCEKYNALSKRERVIVFAVLLVAVYGLVQFTLLDPLLKQGGRLKGQLSEIRQQTQSLEQERTIISAQISAGPNKVLQRELDKLNKQLEHTDARLRASTVSLIPPALMPEVMQEVLGDIKSLRLVNLENRGAVLLTKAKPLADAENSAEINTNEELEQPNDVPGNKLYRHSFVLTLEGSYQASMQFFQALEKKPWKFFWQNMRYEVIKYPKAKIILEVYTLSAEENWIGV